MAAGGQASDPERRPDADRAGDHAVRRARFLVDRTATSKTVQLAQRAIGRQTSAKVEWTFDRDRKRVDFRTLAPARGDDASMAIRVGAWH